MKTVLCLLLLLAFGSAAIATDTAYAALRAYGKQNGPESLKHVLELRGRAGTPAPETWKITVADSSARGGVREMEMRHGHVVSERTPVSGPALEPMSFSQLNLDSDGVFTIATQDAEKHSISFDHLDYTLKAGAQGGAPVWRLDLMDGEEGRVYTLDIAADSGDILHREIVHHQVAPVAPLPPDVSEDRAYVDQEPPNSRAIVEGDGVVAAHVNHFFHKVEHHFVKRERQFESFFSGRGWTDR